MKEIAKESLKVSISDTRSQMGAEAAEVVSQKIKELLEQKDYINIVFAAAPSQNEFLSSLGVQYIFGIPDQAY